MLALDWASPTWSLTVTQTIRGTMPHAAWQAHGASCACLRRPARTWAATRFCECRPRRAQRSAQSTSTLQYDEHDLTLPSGTIVHQ